MTAKTKPLRQGRTEAQVLAQILEAAAMLGIQLDRRNTGMAMNPKGQPVRFGSPGDSDLCGTLPGGRTIQIETKHEHFNPSKLKGDKREHFERQLSKLKEVNVLGGVGFWADDATEFLSIMRHVLDGASVVEPGYGPLEIVYPDGKAKGSDA